MPANNPTAYYGMNRKPLVKATEESAFNSKTYRQGSTNKAPVTSVPASKSAYSESVMPKNKVTNSSSAKLQQASRLPGRVQMSSKSIELS